MVWWKGVIRWSIYEQVMTCGPEALAHAASHPRTEIVEEIGPV